MSAAKTGSKKNFSLQKSWKSNSWSVRILRGWLGFTFIFAGWNKASDSGFLNSHSAHYIGRQLNALIPSSPISKILIHMVEHAQFIGWGTIIAEFVVGFATLIGVMGELFAFVGFSLSLVLWLSVTWNVTPYFLGSDTAYMVLWAALGFGLWSEKRKAGSRAPVTSIVTNIFQRREFLQTVGIGAMSLVAVGVASRFQHKLPAAKSGPAEIVTLDALPIGASYNFIAKDGTQAVLFRTTSGVYAYSRTCTHQGCIVDYNGATKLLQCPCHGAQYDPTQSAKVVGGPAPAPLAKINVAIRGQQVVEI